MSWMNRFFAVLLFIVFLVGCADPEPTAVPATSVSPATTDSPPTPSPATTPLPTPTAAFAVQMTLIGSNADLGSVRDVTVAGDLAFLADSRSGLRVVSLADSNAPQEIGFFDPTGSTAGQGVFYAEPILYLADGLGLEILDLSDPAAPQKVGFYHPPGFSLQAQRVGQILYTANREGGLGIADVSDPANPQPLSTYFDVGTDHVLDLDVQDQFVFAAMDDQGLRIVDVSDPAGPQEIGSIDSDGTAESIAVSGAHAFLADGEGGVRIYDVTDPAQPQEIAVFETADYAQELHLAGRYAFVGAGPYIQVLAISDPENPLLAGEFATSGVVWGIDVVEDLVYVANANYGLLILQLNE